MRAGQKSRSLHSYRDTPTKPRDRWHDHRADCRCPRAPFEAGRRKPL